MKAVATTAILFVLLAQAAPAEYRMWVDKEGSAIEAEHVRTTADQVVLRKRDGSQIRVKLDALSDQDRQLAYKLAPLEVEIDASVKVDRSNTGYSTRIGGGMQVQEETVDAAIAIRKTSTAPYEGPLSCELFILGSPEQSDGYIVVERATERFEFSAANKYHHSFEPGPIRLRQLETGHGRGIEYEGYLCVVRDAAGTPVAAKASNGEFRENAEAILDARRGDVFDEDFRPQERRSDSQRRKTGVLPGRRF